MKNLQIVPYPLSQLPYAAGGRASYPLDQIPLSQFGRIAHLVGFLLDVRMTPTFTTAPTLAGFWSVIQNLVFFDSASERQNLSAFQLRAKLIQECGKNPMPDPDLNGGTGSTFYGRLFLPAGPLNSAGWSTDWIYPVAALKSGELRLQFGALTSFSADTTGITGTVGVTALLAVLDGEIRVPPAYERRAFNYSSNDVIVQGKALYNSALMMKQSNGAFSAGDVGNITIDTGAGSVPATPSVQWSAIAQLGNLSTIMTQLRGEPLAATDDNEKVVNLSTPTAIAAADPLIQSIIPPIMDGRISKLQFEALSGMRFFWSGTFNTPSIVVGRILSQPLEAASAIAAKATEQLGRKAPTSSKVKTLSGREWRRGLEEAMYMPFAFRW